MGVKNLLLLSNFHQGGTLLVGGYSALHQLFDIYKLQWVVLHGTEIIIACTIHRRNTDNIYVSYVYNYQFHL